MLNYSPLIILAAFTGLSSAQIWADFTQGCNSWEGEYGTLDGTTGRALLSATCISSSGQWVASSLDLNTCFGSPSPGVIQIPSSGLFDSCIVTNVPNSLDNPISGISSTTLQVSCLTNGEIGFFNFDFSPYVGNNNGVLACGFM